MSGIKEPNLATFLRLIRHRLGGAGVLAQFAGVGRCHLSSMLHGDEDRGVFTWAKVRRHVTAVEWSFLEQCSAWNSFKARYPRHAETTLRTPVCDSPRDPLMPVVCCVCYRAIKAKRCDSTVAGKLSHGLCTEHFVEKMRSVGVSDEQIQRELNEDAVNDRAAGHLQPGESERIPQLSLSSV